jgi:O-antigen ligase
LAGLVLLKGRVGQVGLLVGLAWMAWKAYTVVKHRVWALSLLALLSLLAWNTLESVRQPFLEAIHEIQESQQGYPHSEPEFSSMGMRFTYWKTYLDLWMQHPWWGVGTGDMVPIGRQLFENHPLEIPYHRPHQQWLELGVQLGLPGVGLLALAWWLLWKHRPLRDRSWVEAVHLIFAGSMFLDCTLSTQAGISAFMALLLALHFQGWGPVDGKREDQSGTAHSKA